MNSRDKGKRGERAASAFLRSLGYEARRSQQYCGEGKSDVTIEGRGDLHIEVKYCYPRSALHVGGALLDAAIEQVKRDADPGQRKVVLWKAKGERRWKMTWEYNAWWVTTADPGLMQHVLGPPTTSGPTNCPS